MSQICLSNTIVEATEVVTSPFNFEVPVYTLQGATFQYYEQTTEGISANLNNIKTLVFLFSGNTESLTGTTKLKHDIYRIDYNTYTAFTSTPIVLSSVTTNIISGTSLTTKIINPEILSAITQATFNIISAITQPFYTTFEEVSGSTFLAGSAHTLTLPQKVKPDGQYTQDLFVDKAQYFVDSTFVFEQGVDQTVGDVRAYSGGEIVQLYNMPFSSTTYVQSSSRQHTITGGTFSGATINGATFTYFVPPKKSDIYVLNGEPSVQGILSTFAPIFSFNNVEDGDYYKVQVNYNTGDTSFTGDTTIFKFPMQPGNPEYIRTVAAALTPNAEFIYRIGNTKEIINLFQVKQNITTWSEFTYAKTSNDGTFELSGHTWYNQISGTPFSNAILSITVKASISSVDLGSDTPLDPNTTSEITSPLGGAVGSTITVVSDANGRFSFGKINGGLYTIIANPNNVNYPTQTISLFLTQDTNIDVIFSIIWGNTSIDFTNPFPFL